MAPRDLVLVALSGDVDPGTLVPVPRVGVLEIGRAARGVTLLDPLVSMRHAAITFEAERGYVIEDLDSVHGTWVDMECIRARSVPIAIGTRLRFGGTSFEVRAKRWFPHWIYGVMAGASFLAIAAVVLMLGQRGSGQSTPRLRWDDGIQIGPRNVVEAPVAMEFLRLRGLHAGDLQIRAVSDYDFNGRDEIRLSLGNDQDVLVVIEDDDSWTPLGEFPSNCRARDNSGSDVFPLLDCDGVVWALRDGVYRPVDQSGAVVWYRTADPDHGEKSEIQVARMVVKAPAKLAGFLASRGVDGAAHYILCEDAHPGLRSQARGEDGVVRRMSVGCLSELRMEGRIDGDPVAVALSAVGREMLLKDVRTFFGGNDDGVYLDGPDRERLERWAAPPGPLRGGVTLVSSVSLGGPEDPYFNPMPADGTQLGVAALAPTDRRETAAPLSTTVTVTTPGVASVDLPGCAKLRIETRPFRCFGVCSLMWRDFIQVEEVGCGEPTELFSHGYGSGSVDAEHAGHQFRLVVDAHASPRGVEVARARVAYRGAGE